MKAEKWIPRLNERAKRLDALCAGVHPSVIPYLTAQARRNWKRLALAGDDGNRPRSSRRRA